ncbi:MAG TPA: DNA recombination protein RmuC, partial [Hyphomicrobiaceae bacterium]|nr:DNA recombination protein RmuC [Hyphomicrobiaceae bacterium]
MDAFGWLVSGLTLLLGLVAGAAGLWWLVLRARYLELAAEHGEAVERLAGLQASLASEQARNEFLQAHAAGERERAGQDQSVLQVLAPVTEKLRQVQQQVTVLERDRVEQFGQLSQQLITAAHQDAAILRTTASLAGALRNTSARGTWGEVQ